MSHIPYTYLIGWSKLNTWYYGVRYAKNCNPTELFVTYFTSSKYVKQFILEHNKPDVIEIRKTFNSIEKARAWELKVLQKMKVKTSDNWLNKHDKAAPPIMYGPCSNKRKTSISNSRKNTTKISCPYCGKLSDPGNAKIWHFDNCKKNPNINQSYYELISIRLSTQIKNQGKQSYVQKRTKNLGKDPHIHNKIKHTCPHCLKQGNGPVMKRHHFSNCPKYVGIQNQT